MRPEPGGARSPRTRCGTHPLRAASRAWARLGHKAWEPGTGLRWGPETSSQEEQEPGSSGRPWRGSHPHGPAVCVSSPLHPQGVPEDLLLFYNHLRKGGGVVRVDQSLLLYRYHPSAATHSVLEYADPRARGGGAPRGRPRPVRGSLRQMHVRRALHTSGVTACRGGPPHSPRRRQCTAAEPHPAGGFTWRPAFSPCLLPPGSAQVLQAPGVCWRLSAGNGGRMCR